MATLEVSEFGRQLITTGDLDPVYIALYRASLPPDTLKKWLLAYWCFYHMGTASWIVDQGDSKEDYWKAMYAAARSSSYPRGTERRHFRGELATSSVAWFDRCSVDTLFNALTYRDPVQTCLPLKTIMERVCEWRGFGDWIAFKVADMLERLNLCPISFQEADTYLFKSPQEGAKLVVERYYKAQKFPLVTTPEAWAFNYLRRELGDLWAPPSNNRIINGQEIETVLCKWKSHLGGHYHVGKDIAEIRHGLLRFAKSPTAQLLLREAWAI